MLFRKKSKKVTSVAGKSTWKKEVALLFIGSILTLGGSSLTTILTNHESERKDFLTERRQKLEVLVTDIYLEQACTLSKNAGNSVSSDCQSDIPAYQSMTYAKLYFPELYESVATYQKSQLQAQIDMENCLSKPKEVENGPMQARLDCLTQYEKNLALKKISADSVVDKAHQIENGFIP